MPSQEQVNEDRVRSRLDERTKLPRSRSRLKTQARHTPQLDERLKPVDSDLSNRHPTLLNHHPRRGNHPKEAPATAGTPVLARIWTSVEGVRVWGDLPSILRHITAGIQTKLRLPSSTGTSRRQTVATS